MELEPSISRLYATSAFHVKPGSKRDRHHRVPAGSKPAHNISWCASAPPTPTPTPITLAARDNSTDDNPRWLFPTTSSLRPVEHPETQDHYERLRHEVRLSTVFHVKHLL